MAAVMKRGCVPFLLKGLGLAAGLEVARHRHESGGSLRGAKWTGEEELMAVSTSLHSLPAGARLEKLLPLAWVHVPKAGSTIMNSFIKLPGVCPRLPAGKWLCYEQNPDCRAYIFNQTHPARPTKIGLETVQDCPGIQRFAHHHGFSTQYQKFSMKGHGVIMLRQPEQRLMSGWFNNGDHHGWVPWGRQPSGIPEYVHALQGAVTKMLTRDTDQFDHKIPTPAEAELAVERLREGFAFIGIVEEHALSMCMVHKMFGGKCHHNEFSTRHHGLHRPGDAAYDISPLQGFRDPFDNAVYAEGLRIFEENKRVYNVSAEACRPCWEQVGLSLIGL